MRWLVMIPIALGASLALAEDRQTIVVTVGQTVERDVGWAMGHVCDDPAIVDATMRNKDPETNAFVVTGKQVGTTTCRAGTHQVENRPTFLFDVRVVAALPRR